MLCKRAQKMKRKVNQQMRLMNENILEDSLWKGRFEVRMDSFHYRWYEDKSGVDMYFVLKYIDHKTGKYWLRGYHGYQIDGSFLGGWHMFQDMNTYITEICKVWDVGRDSPDYPTNDKTVYRRK